MERNAVALCGPVRFTQGSTNDACHASIKEDMRIFRQKAGSDASIIHWAEVSVWARCVCSTCPDYDRIEGGVWEIHLAISVHLVAV